MRRATVGIIEMRSGSHLGRAGVVDKIVQREARGDLRSVRFIRSERPM